MFLLILIGLGFAGYYAYKKYFQNQDQSPQLPKPQDNKDVVSNDNNNNDSAK